jgi:hypothetical protein
MNDTAAIGIFFLIIFLGLGACAYIFIMLIEMIQDLFR